MSRICFGEGSGQHPVVVLVVVLLPGRAIQHALQYLDERVLAVVC